MPYVNYIQKASNILFSPLSVSEAKEQPFTYSKSLLKMIEVANSFSPLTFSFDFQPVKLVPAKNHQLTVSENKFLQSFYH